FTLSTFTDLRDLHSFPTDALPILRGAIDTFRPNKNRAGVITFIISEAGFFGVLILAYLFYNATAASGPGSRELNLLKTSIFSVRSEEHTSELQSLRHLVCRRLLEK